MAVIRNNINEVSHILNWFPDMVTELDIYGQSPFHLAAEKPQILALLVENANLSLLNQRDQAGITVLERAVIRSSSQCINGSNYKRCRRCACTQSMAILIEAGCDIRMYEIDPERPGNSPLLHVILNKASELARRRYIFHMKELRASRQWKWSPRLDNPTNTMICELESGTSNISKAGPIISQFSVDVLIYNNYNEVDTSWGWVYYEINNSHLGDLFFRHGFRPHPSFFVPPRRSMTRIGHTFSQAYIFWLVEHGVDLLLRSATGPPVIRDSPDVGWFAAHHAFYLLGLELFCLIKSQNAKGLDVSNKHSMAITHRNLTDGCQCYCTQRGCTPFIWMMKGMVSPWWCEYPTPTLNLYAKYMAFFYSGCGPEMTILTWEAAIRYATFEALGLTHTCCSAEAVMERYGWWTENDDVDITNEEQALLLELHRKLVEEFTETALEFIVSGPDGRPLFPDFWKSHWVLRMEEVLSELDGQELTDEERRGAEEIGVRWYGPAETKEEHGNPYDWMSLEYDFYELDLICPEYKEPWPEGLRRVHEVP